MNQSEYGIIASMSRYSYKNDFDMALDFINQFVIAGVEEDKAINHVTDHFNEVSKDRLIKAWIAA